MKRQWLVIVAAFGFCSALCFCAGGAQMGQGQGRRGGQKPPRPADHQIELNPQREVIEALLKRSRLLEDVNFRIPRSLWVSYQRALAGPPRGAETAPVDVIAARGVYRLAVARTAAVTVDAEIHLHVFRPTKVRHLGVLTSEVAWTNVRAAVGGGKPAPVNLASAGGWMRYTPGAAGVHVIHARTTLDTLGGRHLLLLPTLRTVQTLVAFDSPKALHVTDPSAPQSFTGTADKGTHGVLALKPTRRLNVTYRPPVVLTEREATCQVRGPVAWNIDAGGQDVTARLDVAVLAGRTDRLEVTLPAGADRASVTGPDVREVRLAAGSAAVHLRGRITGRTVLTVKFALPAVRDHASVLAGLGVRNGRWAGGTLVVTNSAGSSEIMSAASAGLKELALADIPRSAAGILAGRTALAYDITGRTWRAGIDVVDLGEFALRQTLADLAHYEIVYRDDGSVICKADYEIRNRNRQFLRISLPAGSQVLLARVNEQSRPITPVGRAGDEYLLPLVRSKASVIGLVSFPVEIVYICRAAPLRARGHAALELPRIDVPIAYAWAEAYLPEAMTVARWSGPMKRVDRYSSETATALMSYGRSELVKGYKREDRFKPVSAPPARPPATQPARPDPEGTKPTKRKPPKGPVTTRPAVGFDIAGGTLSLGRNYYRSGKERYERKDLAGAERALEQAMKLAPKSQEADNAKRLLANIKLARGKLALKTRSEKASGSQVLQDIQEGNRPLLEQQQQVIEKGFKAIRKGDRDEAMSQFQAAEALSKQLIARGEKSSEQFGVLRGARAAIAGTQLEYEKQTKGTLGRIKELRDKGRYTEALKLVERFRDEEVSNAPDAPEQQKLRQELGDLAVLAAQREAELRAGLQKPRKRGGRQAAPQDQRQPPARTKQTYDVRDLLVAGFGDAGANDLGGLARSQEDRDRDLARLTKQAREIAMATNGDNTVTVNNGRLVVTGDPVGQDAVRKLIGTMRLARGANVARGQSLSLQWAKGGEDRKKDADKDRLSGDQEFRRFLDLNYAWQRDAGYAQGQGQGQGQGEGQGRRGGQIDVGTITEKLRQNWGQKTQVGSINIDTTAGAARSLGIRFRKGNNDVTYTTIDEAQFRTLMQMDARNRAAAGRAGVAPNRQRQDTVVGTDALLANRWAANVTYSADAGNTIDIRDNPVNIRHEDYILIDNNGYLTAVRAGKMQHWRDRAEVIEFVETPQDIDVPRAGRLVRFEKTLIRPDDRLTLTATYTREGK